MAAILPDAWKCILVFEAYGKDYYFGGNYVHLLSYSRKFVKF